MKDRKTSCAPLEGFIRARKVGQVHRECLPESGQAEPQKEYKLEGEVKGKPVDNIHQALNDAVQHD
jgi:hypothetical protein